MLGLGWLMTGIFHIGQEKLQLFHWNENCIIHEYKRGFLQEMLLAMSRLLWPTLRLNNFKLLIYILMNKVQYKIMCDIPYGTQNASEL